jgi:hypothetical protein
LRELRGVKLATEHQHAELAEMPREAAKAHYPAVHTNKLVITP